MRLQRVTGLVVAVTCAALALPAAATATAPVWHHAQRLSLPIGGAGLPQGYLPALSCPSTGNCSAGGAFSDATGKSQGLLLDEVNGTWRAPTKLRAPRGAATNPAVTVDALSCGSAGNCSVVGSYQDIAGSLQSFVANEVRRKWSRAVKVALPLGAATKAQNSATRSIDCPSPANCSAVGTYVSAGTSVGHLTAFTLSEVRGTWTRARQVALPRDANTNPFVTIIQVDCAGPGRCSAVGSYVNAQGASRGLVVDQINAGWARGVPITLPGDANAFPSATLSEVACVASGNCTALGTYTNNAGAVEGLTVIESDGIWTRAVTMAMPAGAATNPHVFFYGFGGLSCRSIGNCAAGGQYRDGAGQYQGFFINESDGAWQPASELTLPNGALAAGKNGGVVAVSCRSVGSCRAGAAYIDGAGNYQALVVNEQSSHWQQGTIVALPAGATTVGVDGGVYGLVCTATDACTATGSYLASPNRYQGFSVAFD